MTDGHNRQNEWLSRHELALLKHLTGLDVTAARLHHAPRKRLQKPPRMRNRARTTILIGKDPSVTLVVQENAAEVKLKPSKKTAFEWKGLSIFHTSGSIHEGNLIHPVYVELPAGIAEVKMDKREREDFENLWEEELKDVLVADTLYLKLKANKKELDPKYFDAEEKKQFQAADLKEWQQWIDHKVVRFVPPAEAKRVPASKVFKAPMRYVRVNKATERLAPLVAKSRLIIPGHLDPEVGQHRTDSPTASVVTTRLLKFLAVSRGYAVYSFDVSTAFLRGKHLDREVYVRAPVDGLPKTPTTFMRI